MITRIKEILVLIRMLYKPCIWLYQWIMMLRLEWGDFDYPSSKSVHYYMIIKSTVQSEHSIKVSLKSPQLSPTSFTMRIAPFVTLIGREHLQEFELEETINQRTKEVEFTMPSNTWVRLSVEGNGGNLGTLLHQNYELNISAPSTKIKYKSNKILLNILNGIK